MIRAIEKMVKDHDAGKLETEDITEGMFFFLSGYERYSGSDLLIRTSGEQRLSNYLLWQLAYSILFYTGSVVVIFQKAELEKAVEAYNQRQTVWQRKRGGIMFKTRLISGIVLVALALLLIITGGNVLLGALCVISLIGMFELYRIFKIEKRTGRSSRIYKHRVSSEPVIWFYTGYDDVRTRCTCGIDVCLPYFLSKI